VKDRVIWVLFPAGTRVFSIVNPTDWLWGIHLASLSVGKGCPFIGVKGTGARI